MDACRRRCGRLRNEPWAVSGPGAQGLLLPVGAVATSACEKAPHDRAVVRFFARSLGGGGAIHVEVLVDGTVADAGVVTVGGPDWSPAAQAVAPGSFRGNGATKLQVRLTSVGAAPVEVDDVYVDPYKMS